MDNYIIIYVTAAGETHTAGHKNIEDGVVAALEEMESGRFVAWLLGELDWKYRNPDGIIEALMVPICQSTNWHKFNTDK